MVNTCATYDRSVRSRGWIIHPQQISNSPGVSLNIESSELRLYEVYYILTIWDGDMHSDPNKPHFHGLRLLSHHVGPN